jgi:dTDP-glucose 4,6-dehydratase
MFTSMRLPHNNILITGGAGFIGSALIRMLYDDTDATIINLDKLTYAGDLARLKGLESPRYQFVQGDIADSAFLVDLVRCFQPDAIMHLAAESHVDRSIDDPTPFIATNVHGTYALLEAARRYYVGLPRDRVDNFRFLHVSTDEVFGTLGAEGMFTEESQYRPNSPYSASKAASDHLVRAWGKTYGLPVLTVNCSNNYGPYQYPEKLIPLMISQAVAGLPLPVYGSGANIRDWLHVTDHASALLTVLTLGRPGEVYTVGGGQEISNLELVQRICDLIDARMPTSHSRRNLIEFVTDRPGHDHRYAIDHSKLTSELNWRPQIDLARGLAQTVDWYLANLWWTDSIRAKSYDGTRLGLTRSKTA